MGNKLLVIILDSADIGLIRNWSGRGILPNLKRVMERGAVVELGNYPVYRNEAPWESFLTGCFPDQTGYWSAIRYDPGGTKISFNGAYSYDPYLPFYVLAKKSRITVFDLPHVGKLFPGPAGIQALGWGAHFPLCDGISEPARLISELEQNFGTHNAMKIQNRGTWWDSAFLERIRESLLSGLKKSGKIHRYLLKNYPADLTVFSFSEIHTGSHHFWHLTDRKHPLYGRNDPSVPDHLREIYIETDTELGMLLNDLPSGTDVLIASPMGGGPNWYTANSMIFLPELLYRWNFPNKQLFSTSGEYGSSPVIPDRDHWVKAVWSAYYRNLPPAWIPRPLHPIFRKAASFRPIEYPFYGTRLLGTLQWQPATWYRPWWKKMRAFAIPGYGDGYIRINLSGRDKNGIVPQSDLESVCGELTQKLRRLSDPSTGLPVVQDIIRSSELPDLTAPPDADLTVIWRSHPNDSVADDEGNHLGPVPHWKSGSHSFKGFIMSQGLEKRTDTIPGTCLVTDVAPTILNLLGEPVPAYMKGKVLFK